MRLNQCSLLLIIIIWFTIWTRHWNEWTLRWLNCRRITLILTWRFLGCPITSSGIVCRRTRPSLKGSETQRDFPQHSGPSRQRNTCPSRRRQQPVDRWRTKSCDCVRMLMRSFIERNRGELRQIKKQTGLSQGSLFYVVCTMHKISCWRTLVVLIWSGNNQRVHINVGIVWIGFGFWCHSVPTSSS